MNPSQRRTWLPSGFLPKQDQASGKKGFNTLFLNQQGMPQALQQEVIYQPYNHLWAKELIACSLQRRLWTMGVERSVSINTWPYHSTLNWSTTEWWQIPALDKGYCPIALKIHMGVGERFPEEKQWQVRGSTMYRLVSCPLLIQHFSWAVFPQAKLIPHLRI